MFGVISNVYVFIISVIVFYLFYLWRQQINYWKHKKIPSLTPYPIFGHFAEYLFMRKAKGLVTQEICNKFPDEPLIGTFFCDKPMLIVQDPEFIKIIASKDYYYFSAREIADYINEETITKNVFSTYGDRWRVLRQNLTPLFSSAKLKNMFHLVLKCNETFNTFLNDEIQRNEVIEVKSLLAKYTMDGICSCAFGVDPNTMGPYDPNNPFTKIGEAIFSPSYLINSIRIARLMWPYTFYKLGLRGFPAVITDFFDSLLKDVIKERNNEPSARNDFVDLLLTFKKKDYITGDSIRNMKTGGNETTRIKVDEDFLSSHCALIFAAGFDTTASSLSFTLYELAKHPEAQKRVIEEVESFLNRHEGKITYDCIYELPYLDACIHEALRLYPVLGNNSREVTEDYYLPSGAKLEKGLRVEIAMYHLHHHPKYFPEPETFIPERFFGENKDKVNPYCYMPFGVGHRLCIGMRFARMMMFSAFITIFSKHRVELADDMPRALKLEPKAFLTQCVGGLYIKFIRRK